MAMKKTIVRRNNIASNGKLPTDLHPVLARVYAARNIASRQELERSLEHIHPVGMLSGIDQATDLLRDMLNIQAHILIVADFDADGATSCAIAVRALRMMGFIHVSYIVPNRFEYGYGLTPEIVQVASARRPDLIITVDNGISSVEGVVAARQLGIKVLITDHHLPGATLPDADVIVNPNQPGDAFPSKNLAGVGVIFYVMLALRAALRDEGWFARNNMQEPNLARLLDIVALGTVADIVPLDHNNRILVEQGLARIRRGHCCAGIKALIEVAGRKQERVIAADLGFALGPRLNAAGRLEDMSQGIECLLTDDEDIALAIARRLDELNRERRSIETQMQEQALSTLSRLHLEEENTLPVGLCIFDKDWHQGVTGILASRLKERFHRPVIAFAPASGDEIKGSARSIPGLHIRDALDAIAARHPAMLKKFGGHAMAAGMTLKLSDFDAFQKAFDDEVRKHLGEEDLHGIVLTDGELTAEEISLDVAEALRTGGPWGQGFPEPVFDGVFDIANRRVVGERHLKLLLQVPGKQHLIDAIAFNTDTSAWPDDMTQIHIAYKLDVNEYRGQRNAQLIVEHVDVI